MDKNPPTKSIVVAIPRSKLIQKNMVETSLKTHNNLTPEDRKYATEIINKIDLTNIELAKFILQIYKLTNIGRFSLTYNMDLDTHIKAKVPGRIRLLVKTAGKKTAWPELYDNNYLTSEEIEVIATMANREYYAILNTIENSNSCGGNGDLDSIISCRVTKDNILSLTLSEGINHVSIYSKCYDSVCISESGQTGKIISLGKGGDIPQIAYVADGPSDRFCFLTIDLIKQLAKGDYINPKSGVLFSTTLLDQLLHKYEKEIKMYKKYIDILSKL